MPEREIIIDGKTVPMKSTGATPVFYRKIFTRDIFKDLMSMQDGIGYDKEGKAFIKDYEKIDFGTLERIAYTMAYQADHQLPEFVEWLDQFDSSMAILNSMDQFMELYTEGLRSTSASKNS